MGPFNVIVSNPPYVSEAEWIECDVSVRSFEPKVALVGGEQGWALPAELLKALSKSGLLAQANLIGLELGISHPEILARELGSQLAVPFTDPLQLLACQRPVWEFPRNGWFAVKDYTQRSRYLFSLRSKTE
jgi:release factor glutamine methyltransferase